VISCISNVNFFENNDLRKCIFKVYQGLELQHVRRRIGATRLQNTTGSRGVARSMFFFESTRFHVVRRRFRRYFRRRKTEDSHHMWLTQVHNFHFRRPWEPRGALYAAFSNVNYI
jgi:hypothetical protein